MAKFLVKTNKEGSPTFLIADQSNAPICLDEFRSSMMASGINLPETNFTEYTSAYGYELRICEDLNGEFRRTLKEVSKLHGWNVTKVEPNKLPVAFR